MARPYEIRAYSIQTLKTILAVKSGALPTVVDGKLHTLYFEHYFKHLGAATILVENDYVDRDYMEDYAGFYVRCFGKYGSSCTRLHFFDRPFTPKQFEYTIKGRGRALREADLQKSYLGFVVVKRLPKTFIGKTCLRTYASDNGRRYYPTLRSYPVGLFGLNLHVNETLGFQEQDRGASACATSALWTVFQGTGKLFQHNIPSPVEITQMATQIPEEAVPGILPSRGLTGRQEISAIRQLGLEADYTNAQDQFNLTGSVYAYLRAGVPLLLNVSLYDVSAQRYAVHRGGHAVAVTGFSLGRTSAQPYGPHRFKLRATRIDKLYVHDDQVGPFARMLLDGIQVTEKQGNRVVKWNSLYTSWKGEDGIVGSMRAVPRFHLIPLYPKIRIRFEFIRSLVTSFDKFMREAIFGPSAPASLPSPFEWDIYLTSVNDLKANMRTDAQLTEQTKRRVLLENMPRFIWRARAMIDAHPALELLFDATDIEQGNCFVRAVEYDKSIYSLLKALARSASADNYYLCKPYWRILGYFTSHK